MNIIVEPENLARYPNFCLRCGFRYEKEVLICPDYCIELEIELSPSEHEEQLKEIDQTRLNWIHGKLNPAMLCPHCNEKKQIRTKYVDHKRGISGGKATAALFTGGISLFVTGLSRKEYFTQAHCANCNNIWEF